MQRLKFAALAVAVVLIAGASFSSQAQQKTAPRKSMRLAVMPPVIMPPVPVGVVLSGTYVSRVNATELSVGDVNTVANEVYGWTCYGPTKGDLSGHVFMSMNYSMPSSSFVNPAPKSPVFPPAISEVMGGSWSKLIYVDGVYAGSVYGRIVGGTMTWDGWGRTATIELKLTADGGTDAYVGASGNGDFQGLLDRTGFVPSINGTLTLNY